MANTIKLAIMVNLSYIYNDFQREKRCWVISDRWSASEKQRHEESNAEAKIKGT